MTAPILRPAIKDDARLIATLFRIASDGVSDYIWQGLQEPGESLLDVGERRYQREDTEFSYQNCTIAEVGGEPVGMMHAYLIEQAATPEEIEQCDPVMRPFAALEVSGSLYVAGLAVIEAQRSGGIGTVLLAHARERARSLDVKLLSLICFEENAGARKLYERRGFEVIGEAEIVPHPMIHLSGKALLMAAPVY